MTEPTDLKEQRNQQRQELARHISRNGNIIHYPNRDSSLVNPNLSAADYFQQYGALK